MKLTYIKTDKCPVCGCTIIINESVEKEYLSIKIREHANGGRWERRRFACGCEIYYCPNFGCEEISRECSLDLKVIERDEKRNEAKNMLYVTIENLDVDKEYKTRLKDSIKYV